MMKVHTWQMASRLGTCPMNFGGAKRDISQRLKGVFRCQGFGMQSLYPKSIYILTRREGLEFRRLSRFIPVLEGKATTSLFVVDESLACTGVGQQLDKDHRAGGMTTVILAHVLPWHVAPWHGKPYLHFAGFLSKAKGVTQSMPPGRLCILFDFKLRANPSSAWLYQGYAGVAESFGKEEWTVQKWATHEPVW